MARKKAAAKAPAKKKSTAKKTHEVATFHGGPRDGDTMSVSVVAPPFLRLAFPEWCNYFRREDGSTDYDYDMDREPIPHPFGFEGTAQRHAGTYAYGPLNRDSIYPD